MKRFIALTLALLTMGLLLVSCGNNGDETESSTDVSKDISLNGAIQAVIDAYGEDYIPSMNIEEAQLTEIYGISMDNVEKFYAQAPMISTHVDTFMAFQAKEGKTDALKAEVEAYRDKLINESLNYPMNLPKLEASQVVVYDDYVFFILLGKYNDEELSDDELLEYYKGQTQRGIDALNEYFGV